MTVNDNSNNDEPIVSVIINCYNGEKYLREAIDSVYAQTYTSWEIIFWDNASTDRTSCIAKTYDSRLKYYRSDETTLLGEARVLAANKTTGKYLAFLDSDDLWLKDKLQKQINLFSEKNNDLGFVYGRAEIIYGQKNKNKYIFQNGMELKDGNIFSELAKENFITFSSAVVDREKFMLCGGFPSTFKNSTDYWLFMHMAEKYSVGVIQDVCCKYRIHDSNLSSSQQVVGAKESIDVVESFLPNKNAFDGLKYQYVYLAIMYIKEKKLLLALNVLFKKGGWLLFFRIFLNKVSVLSRSYLSWIR